MADQQQIIDYLVQLGYSTQQAQVVWDHLDAGTRTGAVAQAQAAAQQTAQTGYGIPQGQHTAPATGGMPAAQALKATMDRARTVAGLPDPSASGRPVGWQNIKAMPADQLGIWLNDQGGSWTAMMQQPMPTTTKSLYSLPTGVMGPGGKAITLPTVGDQWATLTKMKSDQLSRLQAKLVEGGYYPTSSDGKQAQPRFGVLDQVTMKAFQNLVVDAMLHPDQGFTDLVNQAGDRNLKDLATTRKDKVNQAVQQAMSSSGITNAATLTSTDDLMANMQDHVKAAIGRRFSPEEMQRYVDSYHAGEKSDAQHKYDTVVAKARAAAQGVSDAQVDQFLNAVQHGDGTGQFVHAAGTNALGMDEATWSQWAGKVGLAPGAPATQENMNLVGHEVALYLYDQYGSWEKAAEHWFSSIAPGNAWAAGTPTPSSTLGGAMAQVDTSIPGRVDVVTRAMRTGVNATGAALAGTGDINYSTALDFTENTPSPDAAAELYLQRQNPVEYVGHAAAERAKEFMDFIATPTVNLPAHN